MGNEFNGELNNYEKVEKQKIVIKTIILRYSY